MLPSRRTVLFAASSVVLAASSSSAQSVTTGGGTPYHASAMAGFLTTFNQLIGMQVNWSFNGGGAGSGTWACVGNSCGVSGAGFSLTATGNAQTYFALWNLSGTNLNGFSIDAASANAAFDIYGFPQVGTPGSSYGNEFNYCSFSLGFFCLQNTTDNWGTTATYTRPVGVSGNAPVGDLWGDLAVSFNTPFNGSNVKFEQDMDQVLLLRDAGTPTDIDPEPATMSLLATGLIGLTGAGFRRRRGRSD